MLNIPLYKRGIKENWKMLLVLAAVLTMYFTIIITMFDPTFGNALDELAKAMPELMAIVGMTPTGTSLIGFLSAYLYGFIMLVFPMIFSILCANRLVAQKVDRGSMSYLLAAPVKRSTVAFTQMKVLASGLLVLIVYAALVGIVSSEAFFRASWRSANFCSSTRASCACICLSAGYACCAPACSANPSTASALAPASPRWRLSSRCCPMLAKDSKKPNTPRSLACFMRTA